jgi:GDP/UDP-N,N'-diacetylbacillosamine 2-epimerase (hydrolysing)
MKIAILTSSRADYGIYVPLLKKLQADTFFETTIIAFGTHLSKFHGYTLQEIQRDGFAPVHTISALLSADDQQGIATSYALTALKFADYWAANRYDIVLCLGDRFEMSAAVQAGIPYGIKFAHIHGGETTLGAIDNIYRHQITLAASLHFTSCDAYAEKVISLTGSSERVYVTGALSLDEMEQFVPVEAGLLHSRFGIASGSFALVTFHPETVNPQRNPVLAAEMRAALSELSAELQLVVTMPNADTMGTVFRQELEALKTESAGRVILVENFGKENYFSAMHHAQLLIGNSSSGILEAASFGKRVVNVGDRQLGRAKSGNTVDVPFNNAAIISATRQAIAAGKYEGVNVYYRKGAAASIIQALKQYEQL